MSKELKYGAGGVGLGLLLIGIVVLAFWPRLRAWGWSDQTSAWAGTLTTQVGNGNATTIDFDNVAPVAWDRVLIVAPYTSHRQIEAALGFPWGAYSDIDYMDGICVVIFARDDEVVGWFEYPRNMADLSPVANLQCYGRGQAKFRTSTDTNTGWVTVVKD